MRLEVRGRGRLGRRLPQIHGRRGRRVARSGIRGSRGSRGSRRNRGASPAAGAAGGGGAGAWRARVPRPRGAHLSLAISGVWRQFSFFKDGQCAYILIWRRGCRGAFFLKLKRYICNVYIYIVFEKKFDSIVTSAARRKRGETERRLTTPRTVRHESMRGLRGLPGSLELHRP